jgi:WD40 repeat protein
MNRAILSMVALMVLLSSCGKDNSPAPNPNDATPPARVADLAVQSSAGSTVTLSWTAPGDDGRAGQAAQYDLRYSQASLAGTAWDTATVAHSLPLPKPAGQPESFSIADLANGTWYFALKTADEVPNWSAMSNTASVTVLDTIPPSAVTDLTAVSSSLTGVRLSWTSPGNDGTTGRAMEYDLRRALAPITEETWSEATRAEGLPRPAYPGFVRSFNVLGLAPATEYFFALKTADGAPNWSALSNVVGRSTPTITISRLTFSTRDLGVMGPLEWSPDGQTIMTLADWRESHVLDLFLIPAGGGEPVVLPLAAGLDFWQDPCWSPDGTQIAFVSEPSGHLNQSDIFTMAPIPGAAAHKVTNLGIFGLGACAWSPDGTRIAFAIQTGYPPDTPTFAIHVASIADGTVTALAGANPGRDPAWSPDGSRIAFSSDRSGNSEIYVVPVQGGEPTQLTHDPAYDGSPSWSPDGSQIAFSSFRDGNADIWLIFSEGGDPTRITSDPASEWEPCWSPDGTRIAFIRETGNMIYDIFILAGQEAGGP